MNTIQRIRSALQRPLNSLAALFKEREEHLPLEHDPVGEFLESKKKGIALAEGGASETPPVADVAPQAVGQAIKAGNEDMSSTEKVEAAAQAAGSQMVSPIQSDVKTETPAPVLAEAEKAEAGAALAEAKAEGRAPEPARQQVEAANTPPANSPQEEEKIESVLEVFRSEGLATEATSSLSKELGDMSVYSLLEESKQIAQIAKKLKEH